MLVPRMTRKSGNFSFGSIKNKSIKVQPPYGNRFLKKGHKIMIFKFMLTVVSIVSNNEELDPNLIDINK